MDVEYIKRKLQEILGREIRVEKTLHGKYICKYIAYGMSPRALLADTEAEAYQKLYQYIQSQKGPEPPGAA